MTDTDKTKEELPDKLKMLHKEIKHLEKSESGHSRSKKMVLESEEKYKLLIEMTNTGYVILDSQGRVIDANQEYVRMTGHLGLEEILGKNVVEWTAKHDLERNAEEVRKCFELGFVRNLEIDYVDKESKITPLEINATVLRTSETDRILTVCRDITERKKMEEELLKNSKLESISILTKGITHDFNNLLTSILGYISLSKALVPPSEQAHEYLTVAESACVKAKELTHQLDQFASGVTVVKKTLSLLRLLQDLSGLLAKNSNYRFNLSIPDDLWSAEIDERQISQVIRELVENASDAMPNGGVIDIMAKNLIISRHDLLPLQEGRYIEILVKDHGVGIAKENLPNVFEPYFTTKQMDYRSGVGLGLALCYSIVKAHKGHIVVESELEEGTIVHVYIPALPDKNE
ncbi:MAG: PAS domain S-box protein [Nitrospirae bacterium]|nr:PAS domain S-box protein [Nitrospirota bacterium]